jgi:hypothetical protein
MTWKVLVRKTTNDEYLVAYSASALEKTKIFVVSITFYSRGVSHPLKLRTGRTKKNIILTNAHPDGCFSFFFKETINDTIF